MITMPSLNTDFLLLVLSQVEKVDSYSIDCLGDYFSSGLAGFFPHKLPNSIALLDDGLHEVFQAVVDGIAAEFEG